MYTLIPDHISRIDSILITDDCSTRRLISIHPENVEISEKERTGYTETNEDGKSTFTYEFKWT